MTVRESICFDPTSRETAKMMAESTNKSTATVSAECCSGCRSMSSPPPEWVYITCGVLLLLGNIGAWIGTVFGLPGNWLIVGLAALYVYFLPEPPTVGSSVGLSWIFVAVLGALALAGELIEFLGGAAKARQSGASRRSMVLSLIGAIVGSVLGAVIGAPLGLIGGVLLAVVGGGGGAFGGTYVGEMWKGRPARERFAISRAALFGRLFGTAGKLVVGVVMVTLTTLATFYF